ncbi:hypothetical protein AA309_09115 [Microvirga vignae]|uniref:Uncharacterized protein n=1 Tax=Microvirga vignae TaxID=1225564 RepID=A0A0H1RLF7_9HYPH|nr:hypothetical protein AA309_09115 [Microvirga vignae]
MLDTNMIAGVMHELKCPLSVMSIGTVYERFRQQAGRIPTVMPRMRQVPGIKIVHSHAGIVRKMRCLFLCP